MAFSTPVLELVGWVWTVPPVASDVITVDSVVIVLFRSDTAEIWAVSASFFAVSAAVFTANCAWTSDGISVAVSIPDPELSEVSSACAAFCVMLCAVCVGVGVGVGVLVVLVVVVIANSRLHPGKRPMVPWF